MQKVKFVTNPDPKTALNLIANGATIHRYRGKTILTTRLDRAIVMNDKRRPEPR